MSHVGRGIALASAFFAAVTVARSDEIVIGLRVLLLAWFIVVSIPLAGRMCMGRPRP